MAKFEVEYASFIKVVFEADSQEEANDIASIMEEDDIQQSGTCDGYVIWEEPKQLN